MRAALVLGLLVLLAGCVAPSADVDPAGANGLLADLSSVDAITHLAGDNLSARPITGFVARLLDVGANAAEPTLALTNEGVMFYTGIGFDGLCPPIDNPVQGCSPRTDIYRSKDNGTTWETVTPRLPLDVEYQHPVTGDPMVHVDRDTGRVFDIDQVNILCYELSYSDDLGDSWMPPTSACLSPPADHQTIITAKPRLLPTTVYPNFVYVCYNQIATASCTRSVDGGRTFQPTGPVGAKGVDPSAGSPDGDGLCSSLVGHLATSADGVLYLPRGECRKPMVYVSKDDGMTWSAIQVSQELDALAPPGVGVVAMDPVVEVDEEGTVYYVWQAGDGRLYLSTSADEGATWSPAVDVLAPGLTGASYPAIGVIAPGKLAFSYYATSFPAPYEGTVEERENATWHGFLGTIEDARLANPTVTTVRINPADDPLVRGQCGPDRCPGIYDFMDLDVGADGRIWAGFVDACFETCATPEGTVEDNSRGGGRGFVATLDILS